MSAEPKNKKFEPNYEVVEGYVRFCPCCGRTWQASGDTGEEITCGWDDCQQQFKVFKV